MFRLNEHILILVIQWSSECLIIKTNPGSSRFLWFWWVGPNGAPTSKSPVGRKERLGATTFKKPSSTMSIRQHHKPIMSHHKLISNISMYIYNYIYIYLFIYIFTYIYIFIFIFIYIYTRHHKHIISLYHRPIVDHQKSCHLDMPRLWSWQSGTRGRLAPLPLI